MGETLFDVGAELHHRTMPAADASRSLRNLCWTDCGHCAMKDYHQYHQNPDMRIYKLCHFRRDMPEPVYVFSRACEHFLDSHRFEKAALATKPTTSGWDDY